MKRWLNLKFFICLVLSLGLLAGCYASNDSNNPVPIPIPGAWEWSWLNPLPQGDTLNAVWVNNEESIYAVGSSAQVLHWDGAAWNRMDIEEIQWTDQQSLEFIWGTSDSNIYAGGFGGFFHWDGSDWSRVDTGASDTTRFFAFHANGEDEMYLAAGNGQVFYFNGAVWQIMDTGADMNLSSIFAMSPDDIYVGSWAGDFLHYDGTAWNPECPDLSPRVKVSAIQVFDDGSGNREIYLGGQDMLIDPEDPNSHEPSLWRYKDGEWQALDDELTDIGYDGVAAFWGSGPNDLYFVGCELTVIHWDGQNWTLDSSSALSYWLCGIHGTPDGETVWTVGEFGVILYRSPDTDYKWEAATQGARSTIKKAWAESADRLYISGAGVGYFEDGVFTTIPGVVDYSPLDFHIVSGSAIYAATVQYDSENEKYTAVALFKYDGEAWNKLVELTDEAELDGLNTASWNIWANGDDDIFISAKRNKRLIMFHYDGETLSCSDLDFEKNGQFSYVYSIRGFSADDVWIVGGYYTVSGFVLHYDGVNWEEISVDSSSPLNQIYGTAWDDFYICGDKGSLLKYDGTAFTAFDLPEKYNFASLWYNEPGGLVYLTGGVSGWESIVANAYIFDGTDITSTSLSSSNAKYITAADENNIFICGTGGMILKRSKTN